MAILVVGSMAYDTVETPRERRERQLGGAATFFALAAGPEAGVRVVTLQTPWMPTVEKFRDHHMQAIDQVAKAIKGT